MANTSSVGASVNAVIRDHRRLNATAPTVDTKDAEQPKANEAREGRYLMLPRLAVKEYH